MNVPPDIDLVTAVESIGYWTHEAKDARNRALRAEEELIRLRQERATLHQLFEGFGRLLATSSRDWGAYRVDAWLWAVVLGWDCDDCCDDECTHDVLEQFAREFGWGQEGIDKARRYHAIVRGLAEADR